CCLTSIAMASVRSRKTAIVSPDSETALAYTPASPPVDSGACSSHQPSVASRDIPADVGENDADIEFCHKRVVLCQGKLMEVRGEPLLHLQLQSEGLVCNKANLVKCIVTNIGWGRVNRLKVSIKGDYLKKSPLVELGSLGRKQSLDGILGVVPEVEGTITLKVVLEGVFDGGEILENVPPYPIQVASNDDLIGQIAGSGQNVILNIDQYVGADGKVVQIRDAVLIRNNLLEENDSTSAPDDYDSGVVFRSQLEKQQAHLKNKPLEDVEPSSQANAEPSSCPSCHTPIWGYLQNDPAAQFCPSCGHSLYP
ncbi:MAG: zinc ribbon domain-containing protein, partial [Chloroflexota bacterium]